MPWNEADRVKYDVIRARYSSDMSEAEFALIAPLLPRPKRRGRKLTEYEGQKPWRSGGLRGVRADKVDEGGDLLCALDVETSAEVIPEGDAVLRAGL
jgi:hypothetical protein